MKGIFDENAIRNNIRKYRLRKRLSQQDLADLSGISRTHVSDIERDSHKIPSIEVLCKIAEALSVSVDDLLFENLQGAALSLNKKSELDKQIIKKLNFKSERDLKLILEFVKKLKKK